MNTDRCDGASRRHHDYSPSETACEPSAEESASAAEARRQEADRAADARREAYIQSDEDVGGACRAAASQPSTSPSQCDDDPRLRDAQRTSKIDPPLEDDVAGNAIIGALGGGLVAGARSAAGGAVGRSVLAQATDHAAKDLATTVVKEGVKKGVNEAMEAAAGRGDDPTATATTTATASSSPPSPPGPAPAAAAPAGRSSTRATSEPVKEPTVSVDTTPRIPLPPTVIRG